MREGRAAIPAIRARSFSLTLFISRSVPTQLMLTLVLPVESGMHEPNVSVPDLACDPRSAASSRVGRLVAEAPGTPQRPPDTPRRA
jgi:hypothetical protein